MKLMIASDIHGSAFWCEKLLDAYRAEHADRLLLLGDLLYHGPRNDLPRDYAPKKVIEMLSGLADQILCVRGNCEAEVDQMVLPFPVMAEYAVLYIEGRTIYAAHGHRLGEDDPPPLACGDILLCGHTHISKCAEHEGYIYMNPGSVSIPKQNTPHSYMTFEAGTFLWKELECGKIYMDYTFCN